MRATRGAVAAFNAAKPRRLALAHGLRVARREVGVVRVGADVGQNLPRAGAAGALGHGEHDRDAGDLVEPERRRPAPRLVDLDARGDGDLGQVDAVERRQQVGSVMNTFGAASSEEPMTLSRRAISSAPVTTRRTSRIFSHFSASASSRHSAGTSGNCAQVHRLGRARMALQPALFHGEDQDRREPGGEAVEDAGRAP